MHLGFSSMNNLHQCGPAELAGMLEARNYESLWFGEHAHLPATDAPVHPSGSPIPPVYKAMADPFVTLAVAAATTRRLKLGLGVALVLEREPFNLAKEVATLDQVSGGRVLLGVGVGWYRAEFENAARMPWNRRFAGLADCVGALRALWTQDEAGYQGQWYRFDRVWSFPKPMQRPHPPVIAGVGGELGMGHAARWADGWMPIDRGRGAIPGMIERFRQLVREAGRDPAQVPISVVVLGEPDPDTMLRYRDLGVVRVVFGAGLPLERPGDFEAVLDRCAPLVTKLA
ncbi:MAG: TIGR03619 family F420-dependent LLM class oxidoreductase [Gammaproteobacteria bacterium]